MIDDVLSAFGGVDSTGSDVFLKEADLDVDCTCRVIVLCTVGQDCGLVEIGVNSAFAFDSSGVFTFPICFLIC